MTSPKTKLDQNATRIIDEDSRDGSANEVPIRLPPRIGRYRVERVLGEGGFGRVYLAHDEKLDRPVTIKVPIGRMQSGDADAYLAEAQTLASLDHPRIIPVYDFGSSEAFPCYFVSKFVDGPNLSRRIKEKRFSCSAATELVAEVAEALHYAHKRGFVHRDVKPSNILLDENEAPYLGDFGLALKESELGKGPRFAGTVAYMSPEQSRGEGHRVDGRSDIYSLGVVFYELLVGRHPHVAETEQELRDQVATHEIRPPRQIDDSVPKELERICLKALAKRASERYTTAQDMVEDLRHFLAEYESRALPESVTQPQGTRTTKARADSNTARTNSEMGTLRIVPKGLRSFDRDDADFFLELLPGPRDRDGMPDSLRFWKKRIEETDADNTFSVGLIYGPSGCGKSSLVKAGLLPRLNSDVNAIYIEASAQETESRLLHALRKRVPGFEGNLKDTLAAIRRSEVATGFQKVLVVLDQFEQWLHAKKEEEDTELLQALRQCDGGRVQCIVMVRDDFWMAATRFMRGLEIRLVEAENSNAVDLFFPRHALKILSAFGRAFGDLPDDTSQMSADQKEFLKQAVDGLSEDGKVVCVRIALFAEMIKGKPWVPETLKQVGGTKGVGAAYLEETFSASSAPPEHRYHQRAARAVLKALLPESGSDIKGGMKSYDELLKASGYARRPEEFDDLIAILDSEVRLVTPTDPEGALLDSKPVAPAEPGQRFYQLTHDYLVHSLRDWLTRKQRETRRGRAALRMTERTQQWKSKRESRQLPTLWEFFQIRLLTNGKEWTADERGMMRQAARYHLLRWGSVVVMSAIVVFMAYRYVMSVHELNERRAALRAVESLISAPAATVPPRLERLPELRTLCREELQKYFQDGTPSSRLRAAYGLAYLGEPDIHFLVDVIPDVHPNEARNLIGAIHADQGSAIPLLLDRAAEEADLAIKTRFGATLLYLGETFVAREMLRLDPDPTARTTFIHGFRTWRSDLIDVVTLIPKPDQTSPDDVGLRSGLCLATGQIPAEELSEGEKRVMQRTFADLYQRARDGVTHSAAGWALRTQLRSTPPSMERREVDERAWYVNPVGITMIKLGEENSARSMDAGKDPIHGIAGKFYLADREVSVRTFLQFLNDPRAEKLVPAWNDYDHPISPNEDCPIQMVSWHDAVRFCNWLSDQEGLRRWYEQVEDDPITWRFIEDANGYRLPFEVEWEYACRAGTTTEFSFGKDAARIRDYAVVLEARTSIGGSRLPNQWGLFDMHGNVWEWCHDWYHEEVPEHPPRGYRGPPKGERRVLRGGSIEERPSHARSAGRSRYKPNLRSGKDVGFRVARNRP